VVDGSGRQSDTDPGAAAFPQPFRRQATPLGMQGRISLPGGTSERVGDRFRLNLLGGWLTNETFPSRLYPTDLIGAIDSVTFFTPAPRWY
jgi:hypothetical protein